MPPKNLLEVPKTKSAAKVESGSSLASNGTGSSGGSQISIPEQARASKRFSRAFLELPKLRTSGIPLEHVDEDDSLSSHDLQTVPEVTVTEPTDNDDTDLHEGGETDEGGGGEPEQVRKSDVSGRTLAVLEGSNILDYEVDDFIDPMQHYEAAHIVLMSQKGRHNAWEDEENPTKEHLAKKEKSRLDKLKRDRGPLLSHFMSFVYHVTVVFIFVYSWLDSFKIIIQEAKLQTYHLAGVYNCMEVITKANEVQFCIEIVHALMSACVLFAETSTNAVLCMAFIFSQAVHTVYKAFQLFMQFRFLNGTEQLKMTANFLLILICNVLACIVVIQRYYDLTDRVRTRAKLVATNLDEGGSMNDEIIYQNQSSFIRRKVILRQAVSQQVYRIIQKIDNCKKRGLKLDKIELYKEIKAATLAVQDVDDVDNNRVMKEIKKATARRLKEMENDPKFKNLDQSLLAKTFSELFKVRFASDDVATRRLNLLIEVDNEEPNDENV